MEVQKYTYQLWGQPFDVALLYKNHAAQSILHSSLDREHFSDPNQKDFTQRKQKRTLRAQVSFPQTEKSLKFIEQRETGRIVIAPSHTNLAHINFVQFVISVMVQNTQREI
jgi:hypothetical protein